MVSHTRGTPDGFGCEASSGSQQPPPPPSNLAELMAMQTELLHQLVQGQQNQQRQQYGGREAQPAGYQEFFGTQPPLFSKADDPLDADAWLHTINSKFALLAVPCVDANKAHFAAQQLRGPTRIWWDNYCAMQPAGHIISWEEFRTAFRSHHIPEGLIERKLNEFLALDQGTRTILQYAQTFNHLCQYAGHHADTDAKKRDCFRCGLNTKLKECLNLVQPNTYNELVNIAITQEDCIAVHHAEKKRKAPTGPSSAQPPRYRLVQNTPHRPPQRNTPMGRLVLRPPQQQGGVRPPVPQQQQQQQQFNPRPNAPQFNSGNDNNRCFNCGSTSHFAKNCPQPRRNNPGQNSSQNNNKGKGKRQMVQVR